MNRLNSAAKIAAVSATCAALLALAGCATKPTYQTQNMSGPTIITNAQGVPNYYQVKRGDTVSQIASRYNLSYRQIGALNNLDSKYTIYSGQMLKLWQGNDRGAQQAQNTPRYTPAPATSTPPASSTPDYNAPSNTATGYDYPSRNQVIRNFDAQSNNLGMWFAGQSGDPVYASQSGTVMYAGNGLQEYGNLIMIRHSNDYITAYAHNSELLVKEGDAVQRGQRIASMGSTGQTNQVALEFQVRLGGSPIDPRTVLGR
ncbi:M23 family metallopeptidase [Psychrobacter aestuarii]|uniref:Peptidoglycan DD-metalloendopeptidase family protein n=1 Tax=Psychrobacter aestuarii TaxID=556327 RepID=A0ABN0VNN1_9GAMM|nr:M23 family metallopeptidase [Psychrobacter aestuarii]